MNAEELPVTKAGNVAWGKLITGLTPGEDLIIECKNEREAERLRNNVAKGFRFQGLGYRTAVKGKILTLHILTERPGAIKNIGSDLATVINASEVKMANLPGRIHEATSNANYWKLQINLCEHPDAIERARGRYAAWKMTAARLTAELEATKTAAA